MVQLQERLASEGILSDTAKARQEFAREYGKKSGRWKEELALGRVGTFTKEWPEIRKDLARVTQRTAEIASLMRLSGLPLTPGATTPPTSDRSRHHTWKNKVEAEDKVKIKRKV
jgi:hypothetical protein